MRHWLLIIIYLISTFYLSVAFPLVTYALSLALFGLLHVFSELAYIHQRFASLYQSQKVLGIKWTHWIYLYLALIISLRCVQIGKWISLSKSTWFQLELSLVVLMLGMVFFLIKKENRMSQMQLVIGLMLVSFLIHAFPIEMVLFFSIFHNVTPIFVLWEYRQKSFDHLNYQQQKTFLLYQNSILFAFIMIPILIIKTQPFLWFYPYQLSSLKPWLLETRNIEQHLSVFTLKSWDSVENPYLIISIFSAVVFCQILHYAVVIHLLPTLQSWLKENDLSSLESPDLNAKNFQDFQALQPKSILNVQKLLLILPLISFFFFQIDFFKARQYYGLFASFHAWIELPLFLSLLLSLQGFSKIKSLSI